MEEIEISASVTREADPEVGATVDGNISVGVPGPKGEKGDKGEPGKDGTNGKDGKNAYQYALDGGYTGTEEEFAELMANGTGSGGPSVQTDWNQNDASQPDYLKNRPFGDVPTGGDTLTVPMMSEDEFNALDPSKIVGDTYIKVSDGVPTMQDLSNGLCISAEMGEAQIPPEDVADFVVEVADGIIAVSDWFVFVSEQGVGVDAEGFTFPESGTYVFAEFALMGEFALTIPNFAGFPATKKMDSKYLPEDYINSLIDAKLGVIENGSY